MRSISISHPVSLLVVSVSCKLQLLDMLKDGSKVNDVRKLIADNSVSDYSDLYILVKFFSKSCLKLFSILTLLTFLLVNFFIFVVG